MTLISAAEHQQADFARLQPQIDAALAECVRFDEFSGCPDSACPDSACPDSGCPPHLAEAIRYALLAPGKRLRPQLVLMAAEACGGAVEAALPAACAVEMIHAYSLVHDDLPAMDDDDLRRGRPTCHKAFGEDVAILVGDALQALAFETLARGIQPPERAARCCAVLGQAAGATALVGGQAADLAANGKGDLATLEAIHRRKTGALFLASLRLGGIAAGANDDQMEALEVFGRNLGLAFQIVDDWLDAAGDEGTVGKRLNKDAGQGKATYPELLGIDGSRARAAELIDSAQDALAGFGNEADPLRTLAQFVLERNR